MTGTGFQIDALSYDEHRCTLQATVPDDLAYFEGHFEGNPIVPGIAQLLPLVLDPAQQAWPDLPAPTAIKRLKFRDAIRPGHTLSIELERRDQTVRFEIRRGETVCSRGRLDFA